jgi:phosphatidylinositol glycan class Q protein
MVLDILFGILFLIYLHAQTTSALIVLHWIGQGLQLEVLKKQTLWLMGLPGGFKPNPNLAEFIGNAILDLIYIWNYISTAFIQIQNLIITNLAFSGIIGSTIQVALIHDVLFVCSSHIFILYTGIAWIYNYILKMMGTLINLFNGRKFNVMRNRVDSNAFSLQEFYLGVLIVALIIFLFPTLAMFYFLAFIKLVVSVLGLQICLLIAQILLLNFPFHLYMFVSNNQYILPNSINLEPTPGLQNHIRMIPIKQNKNSLFINLG